MDSVVSAPVANGDFAADAAHFSAYWLDAKQRLARLPAKPKRDAAAFDAAEAIKQAARDARFTFLRRHARTLYDRLTDGRRKVRAHRAAGLRRRRDGAGPRADQRRGRGRGRAAAGRQGRLRDRPGHPVQPVPGRSRRAACISATPCCCRARNRPRRWPSSCATESSISASPGSSARARRPCCCWPTSASSTPRTTRPSPPPRSRADVCILDPAEPGRRAARRGRARGQVCRPPHLQRRHQPHAPLLRQDPVPVVPDPRPGLREQDDARARQARRAARRGRGRFDREAVDLGGRNLRHRRRLPDPAGDRLQHRRRATPT